MQNNKESGVVMRLIKLKEIVSLMAGHPIRESVKNMPDGDTYVVQMKDVHFEKGIDSTNFSRVFLTGCKSPDYLSKGDIVFVSRGHRIFASLVRENFVNTVASPHLFIIRINKDVAVNAAYLAWYINYKSAQRYFLQCAAGSVLKHINRTILENLPIVLPPLLVQQQMVNAHDCQLKEKVLLEKLMTKKNQLLNAVLDQTLDNYQDGAK